MCISYRKCQQFYVQVNDDANRTYIEMPPPKLLVLRRVLWLVIRNSYHASTTKKTIDDFRPGDCDSIHYYLETLTIYSKSTISIHIKMISFQASFCLLFKGHCFQHFLMVF